MLGKLLHTHTHNGSRKVFYSADEKKLNSNATPKQDDLRYLTYDNAWNKDDLSGHHGADPKKSQAPI